MLKRGEPVFLAAFLFPFKELEILRSFSECLASMMESALRYFEGEKQIVRINEIRICFVISFSQIFTDIRLSLDLDLTIRFNKFVIEESRITNKFSFSFVGFRYDDRTRLINFVDL